MRLREPFIKKHVHTWTPKGDYKSGGWDSWGFEVPVSEIRRECSECGLVQCVKLPGVLLPDALFDLPVSVWHLADLEWA